MRIRITKRADTASVLVCVRDDGSEDWQRHEKRQAAHFPLHDLTHYAVEVTLGVSDAFFGLVAQGWAFDDTTGKGKRGAIPFDARVVEHLVGLLDVERATAAATAAAWDASYIAEQLAAAGIELDATWRARLTDERLADVRQFRDRLIAQWHELPAGSSLEVAFPPPRVNS